MTTKEFEQIKSYSHLLVGLLHTMAFDDLMYNRLKRVLGIAEELEIFLFEIERFRKKRESNIIPLRRIA